MLEEIDDKSKIFLDEDLDDRSLHVLKMDVKRTNFVRHNKEELIEILFKAASKYPRVSYYQGMNCIGGFLLNYTDNKNDTQIILEFIVR